MSDNWFSPTKEVKEVKPKKARNVDPCKRAVPTTVLSRLLDTSKVFKESWIKNRLYASQVGDDFWDLNKVLTEFWTPPTLEQVYYISEVRMDQGNTKHAHAQEHWHSAGLCHPICTTDGEFKEPYCLFPDHAIGGRIDLVIPDPKYLKDLDKDKPDAKIEYWLACDIKETEQQYYFGASQQLMSKYRTQVSLYIHWLHSQGIGHKTNGAFWYHCRDTPKKHKLFLYEKEDLLVQQAFDRGSEFIDYATRRTSPNGQITPNWVAEQVALQPSRNWPDYAGVN